MIFRRAIDMMPSELQNENSPAERLGVARLTVIEGKDLEDRRPALPCPFIIKSPLDSFNTS